MQVTAFAQRYTQEPTPSCCDPTCREPMADKSKP